jgi:hypothetical protein
MTDNLPDRREEAEIEEPQVVTGAIYGYAEHFYSREEGEPPVIQNRRIRLEPRCLVCRLVPKLMEEQEYTFEEATDVERDLYRFIYTFWSAAEISRWLRKSHNFEVSHDSVSRHISKHVPDPNVAMIDRVKTYRPDFMNKQFFLNIADVMKLGIMRHAEAVSTGVVPMTTSEFLQVAKVLKDWQEFLGDIQSDKTEKIINAIGETVVEVLAPYPELSEEFSNKFRERLEKIESEEFEEG